VEYVINKARKTKNLSQGWVKVENLGLNNSQGSEEVKTKGSIVAKGGKKRKPRAG